MLSALGDDTAAAGDASGDANGWSSQDAQIGLL
jgi:hypothetical protein